ncbi:hypothetical protein GCM10023226_07300 [Nocardioides nanhaiensis]|uniref:Uncharacterized protein n=1 Tax=Nocardioides nanhaiensis TaxID=1476871 RepID=A0ABP8VXE8_9ACTN
MDLVLDSGGRDHQVAALTLMRPPIPPGRAEGSNNTTRESPSGLRGGRPTGSDPRLPPQLCTWRNVASGPAQFG